MSEFNPTAKLMANPDKLVAFQRNDLSEPPLGIEISPTNSCNAKCDWCFYVRAEYKQAHSQEEMEWSVMEKLMNDLSHMGVKAVTWTGGGDPSVYSRVDDAIALGHSLGLRQGMFTNSYKPIDKPELLDWLRVTITEKFILTKHVERYSRLTKVGVNFNLNSDNSSKLLDLAKKARDIGVQYFQVRPALADRWDKQEPVETPYYLKELETDTFRVVLTPYKWDDYLKPHGYSVCHGHRIVPFVWFNGDVSVCAYHFGRDNFNFGNLVRDGGFKSIWESSRRRAMIDSGVLVIPDCQNCCKLHEINKALVSILSVTDQHFV